MAKSSRVYTWQEVQKHNRHDDSWIVAEGIVYNVTEWAKKHPGGDIILLGGGTDATIMIHSYHANGINPELMQKYAIGEIEQTKEKSYYDDIANDTFYNALRKNVCEYFIKNKINRRGEGAPFMYVKTLFILINFFFGLYHMTVNGSFLGALWMGTFAAEIGINIMHDGSHGAFSKIPYLNTIACWTMDMIGASSYVWESQHVGGHHLWTNLENQQDINTESDPDVFSSYPLMRMHPSSDRKWFHAYQHFYGPVLFMTFTMAKVFYNDFACFFYNKVMHISMNQRLSSKSNLIRVSIWKTFSMIYMLFLPMYYNGVGKGFLLFTLAHFACGIILAFMFIVTHISEGANFLEQGQDIKQLEIQQRFLEQAKQKYNIKKTQKAAEHSWAAMQCRTSVNWSLESVFWSNFSGGLNHQIEHHLFPGICHMHYPQIREIIQKTCAEFEVPYVQYPDIWSAIGGMIGVLKQLGNPPVKPKTQ